MSEKMHMASKGSAHRKRLLFLKWRPLAWITICGCFAGNAGAQAESAAPTNADIFEQTERAQLLRKTLEHGAAEMELRAKISNEYAKMRQNGVIVDERGDVKAATSEPTSGMRAPGLTAQSGSGESLDSLLTSTPSVPTVIRVRGNQALCKTRVGELVVHKGSVVDGYRVDDVNVDRVSFSMGNQTYEARVRGF
jgi:hypothetical protein